MTPTAVFGYGSLVNPESVARTLGRPVEAAGPARLPGWRRRWSLYRNNLGEEKTFEIEPGGEVPPYVLGLNVEPFPESVDGPNGVLIEVTEAELERLDIREMRYDRVDVSGIVEAERRFETVITYTAKVNHFCDQPMPGAVILRRYVRAVEAGFTALGEGQLETYLLTTGLPPVEVVDGNLIRDETPPGNPRKW